MGVEIRLALIHTGNGQVDKSNIHETVLLFPDSSGSRDVWVVLCLGGQEDQFARLSQVCNK